MQLEIFRTIAELVVHESRSSMPPSAFLPGPGPKACDLRQSSSTWIASNRCSPRRIPRVQNVTLKTKNVKMGLFGLGFPEIAVIATIGVFIFGPKKIAELGKDLGGIAGGVKKASSEFREAMEESLAEADRELEEKKRQKEEEKTASIDASASAVSVPESAEPTEQK